MPCPNALVSWGRLKSSATLLAVRKLNPAPLPAQQHLARAFARRRSGSLESIACRWPVSAGFPLGTILRQFGDLSKTESDLTKPRNGSYWPTSADLWDAARFRNGSRAEDESCPR